MKYRSTLFDAARNKIGSIVASENRNGNYFRNKVIPHNPRSAKQLAARAQFSASSAAWRGLTDVQRAGWVSLAAQVTLHDPLGNSYKPTGQQLYVSCNANLNTLDGGFIDTAPGSPDIPPTVIAPVLTASVLTASPHTEVLTVAWSSTSSPTPIIIDATPLFSPGRNFVGRSQYRTVFASDSGVIAGQTIITEWNAIFGLLVVGQKLSVRLRSVSTHGFASQEARADTVVVAV